MITTFRTRFRHLRAEILRRPLFQRRPMRLAIGIFKGMTSMDAGHLAAGVSYYTLFSLFPLILGFLAIGGLVLNSDNLYQRFMAFIEENLPGSANLVTANVDQIVRLSGTLGLIAIVGLLWSASAVFAAILRVVNRAWGIQYDGPFYRSKPRQLLMGLVLGILFLLYATATSVIELLMEQDLGLTSQRVFLELGLGQLALRALPWVISLSILLMIYKLTPRCQTYWRYTWPGALLATLLFELGKELFSWYLASIANYRQVYGPLASVMILLFWIYISALMLILGAVTCHETQRVYHVSDEG